MIVQKFFWPPSTWDTNAHIQNEQNNCKYAVNFLFIQSEKTKANNYLHFGIFNKIQHYLKYNG